MNTFVFLAFCLYLTFPGSISIQTIDNGIAPPEIVYKASPQKFEPKCKVIGKPLDMIFVLDSSGSLKEEFNNEINVIKRIVNHVAIGEDATRVGLVQFSGIARTEFHLNTFYNRKNIMQALDTLRYINGITKIGGAFEQAMKEFKPEFGMRTKEIPKLVFLLSDGRTFDFPMDKNNSEKIRTQIPADIWAYGTGEYIATEALLNYTKTRDHLVSQVDLDKLESMFDEYKGQEICEEVPVCIPGADKPLDLMFILDSSDSLEGKFKEEVNFVHRILNNINVHPQAVRVSMITYAGRPRVDFDFDKFTNTQAVRDYVQSLQSMNGTTRTDLALKLGFETFSAENGARGSEVPKMAIVLTDGHSETNPVAFARRLVRLKNVTVIAVSVVSPTLTDPDELLGITDNHAEHVFLPTNLNNFENFLLNYVSFGCPELGIDGKGDAEPVVRGPIDTRCTSNAVIFTVRTQKPFSGFLYAKDYYGVPGCSIKGDGTNQITITMLEGQCGLLKNIVRSPSQSGFTYNATVMLQFHQSVITRVDQGLDVNCFYETSVPNEVPESRIKSPLATSCDYTLRRFAKDQCVALDARVGETLYHRWECDNPPNYSILVHNCRAETESDSIPIIDDDGCQLDPYILETPFYDGKTSGLAWRDSSTFKFPKANSVIFKCQISLCDMETSSQCKYQVPPACKARKTRQTIQKREIAPTTKQGFVATFNVETRRINVLENENLKPLERVTYCAAYVP